MELEGAHILPLDLASDESIDAFAKECENEICDILINCAGVLHCDTLDTIVQYIIFDF